MSSKASSTVSTSTSTSASTMLTASSSSSTSGSGSSTSSSANNSNSTSSGSPSVTSSSTSATATTKSSKSSKTSKATSASSKKAKPAARVPNDPVPRAPSVATSITQGGKDRPSVQFQEQPPISSPAYAPSMTPTSTHRGDNASAFAGATTTADGTAQPMGQYFNKYRQKSVREIVAEVRGQTFVEDDLARTTIAIEGMQVETMARKRWKWAVTQILEERAAKKEAQQQWVKIAEDAKKRKFRARGSQLVLLILLGIEVFLGLIFVSVHDLRRDDKVFKNDQIQLFVKIQLVIAIFIWLGNISLFVTILRTLKADPTLGDSPVSWIITSKCCMIVAYICCMGYPTTFRAGMLSVLVVFCAVQVFVIFFIMWKFQFSVIVRQSTAMPTVLKALLSLRQHVPANESPMTIGLVESLLDWLSKNKQRKIVMPSGSGFQYMGLAVLFLVASMAITGVVSMRSFQPQILPNETLQDITSEANPLNSTILGQPYFWQSTGQLEHIDASDLPRRLVLVVLTGVRYDMFVDTVRYLRKSTQDDSTVFKVRAQVPSFSSPNWLSLLSGVKPETSGYLGNAIPKLSYFDTILHRAGEMGLRRGIAASTWMGGFSVSALAPFVGNAVNGPDYNTDETTDTPTDVLVNDDQRHTAVLQSLQSIEPYDLFVAHYVHASAIAHVNGVKSDQQSSSSYREATVNLMRRVQAIADTVLDNTVLMVVSDHGQLAAPYGGKGGSSSDCLDVPLFVYKRGWAAEGTKPMSSATTDVELHGIDIAPTVSMLLGIPTPRHNQGQFIEALTGLVYNQTNLLRHREDLLIQARTFSKSLVQLISGGGTKYDDQIDNYVTVARQQNTGAAYLAGYNELNEFVLGQRSDYANTVGSRNVGVAFVVSLLIMTFMVFISQVMTMADPFALFSRKLLKRPKLYFKNPDVRACLQSTLLCVAHYLISYGAFFAGFAMYGYTVIDASILETKQLITLFLVGCLVPSFMTFYVLQRILILRYHQPEAVPYQRRHAKLMLCNNRINFFLFSPVSFLDFEMAYLTRAYGMIMSCFFALIFVLAFSRYYFVVPFVFLNQFIGEADWQARFNTLVLLLITFPMVLMSLWSMLSWSSQKLNANSYEAFEARRRHKEQRMKESMGEVEKAPIGEVGKTLDAVFKSKALQAGSRFAGVATRRRPNVTPEMFDSLEDDIAEIRAETHVLERQIGEVDSRRRQVAQQEKAIRQQLQASNQQVSQSLEEIFSQLLSQIPVDDQPLDEYQAIKDEVAKQNADLQEVESMVIDHIRAKRTSFDPQIASEDTLDKMFEFFGEDFTLEHEGSTGGPQKSSLEKFLDHKRKYEKSIEERDRLIKRIDHYQNAFQKMKVEHEDALEKLNEMFEGVLKHNDGLKERIVAMIAERNNLLQTLKNLKTKRNEVTQQYKTEMFHLESKAEHLTEESNLLQKELDAIELEKEYLFKEIAFVQVELQNEKAKLNDAMSEVEGYRKQLAQLVV